MNDAERFWSKVEKTATCWLWLAARDGKGYGAAYVGGRQVRAHRFAYELLVGPIPEGLVLDHVKARGCQHRHCVNPDHLEAVTNRENLMRGEGITAIAARKTHCPQGHPYDYVDPKSRKRKCRTCRRSQFLAFHARKSIAEGVA